MAWLPGAILLVLVIAALFYGRKGTNDASNGWDSTPGGTGGAGL